MFLFLFFCIYSLRRITSICLLIMIPFSGSFTIDKYQVDNTNLTIGDSLRLSCTSNTWWKSCQFNHVSTGRTCKFQWQKYYKNVTDMNCKDFKDRFTYDGRYYNHECSVIIANMQANDAGNWECMMEEYWNFFIGEPIYTKVTFERVHVRTPNKETDRKSVHANDVVYSQEDKNVLDLGEIDACISNCTNSTTANNQTTYGQTLSLVFASIIILILIIAILTLFVTHCSKCEF